MGDWCSDCGELIGLCEHTNDELARAAADRRTGAIDDEWGVELLKMQVVEGADPETGRPNVEFVEKYWAWYVEHPEFWRAETVPGGALSDVEKAQGDVSKLIRWIRTLENLQGGV